MKRIIFCILLTAACAAQAQESKNALCFAMNWQFGILAGIEHRFNERSGLKADLGAAIFGLVLADALFVVYLLPEQYRWQLALCAGVPNAGAPMTFEGGMVSLGGDILARFKATQKVGIDMRIGAGKPLFFEKDKDIIRDINFPLDLWPDFAVGVSIAL